MVSTVNELFFNTVEHHARPDCLLTRRDNVINGLSTEEVATRVRRVALALTHLGIERGDRVALLSYNRPEWAIADFGILTAGAVTLPIYTTLPADEIAFILKDAGARAIILEDKTQAAKIASVRSELPGLKLVIGMHGGGADMMSLQEVLQRGIIGTLRDHRRLADTVKPDDLATIIYTSGTTGVPKGVMLTHGNLVANSKATIARLGFDAEHHTLSFLPLSHVFQRQIDLSLLSVGASIAYATAIDQVVHDLPVFQPIVLGVVPRFLEKIHESIQDRLRRAPPSRRRFFERSLEAAREVLRRRDAGEPVPLGLRFRRWMGDRLIFRKLRAGLGGRIRFLLSGGAPLAPELAEFFTAVGIPVLQGYGLTETSPVIAINTPTENHLGTVGKPIPNHAVRIADDGEILFKGPSVMVGYYHRPEESAAVLKDGWFHTGDIGEFDADGYLKITDRKKDLFKTSGGKYITPQPLEKKLKGHTIIQNAVVVGANRKFAAVLIVPNFNLLEAQAQEDGYGSGACAELLEHPRVREQFDRVLQSVNDELPSYATLKKFALLERDFTIESGEMTPTFKVKRRVIEERYREVIDRLYANAP